MIKKPELLAPAGSLEKLKIAFQYGADEMCIRDRCWRTRWSRNCYYKSI